MIENLLGSGIFYSLIIFVLKGLEYLSNNSSQLQGTYLFSNHLLSICGQYGTEHTKRLECLPNNASQVYQL